MTFTALLLDEDPDAGGVRSEITEVDDDRLPDGDVEIAVEHSSLNYKDGMILKGIGGLVRSFPHVPGVDLAGTVTSSDDDRFSPGDRVVCTGWRVGEVWWGGYATKARLRGDWLVALPSEVSTRQAMAIGTAGFTAMQSLLALEDHGLAPGDSLLVTGASGGVGSSALLWAGARGHTATASTGSADLADHLRSLGATDVIDRAELEENPSRPLLSERWAGCIDAVGGDTLAHVLAETKNRGSVAACGLVGGNRLATTVIPFLLRGVNLLGIDSVMAPAEERARVWAAMAEALADSALSDRLEAMTSEIGLADLDGAADRILAGATSGRIVVTPTT